MRIDAAVPLLLLALACQACGTGPDAADAPGPAAGHPAGQVIAAAAGRVEGAGEAVDLGAGVEGVIAAVFVRAGDTVCEGDVLAELQRADIPAEVAAATAALHRAQGALRRLLRGGRDEERRLAAADAASSQAVLDEASTRYARTQALFAAGAEARSTRDAALRDLRRAEADFEAAREAATLAAAAPLDEETSIARAAVAEARARLRAAEERAQQRYVRAPFAGTIVRVHMHAGETYSVFSPRPILTLADLSARRVRAEVDERDTPHVRTGQAALIEVEGAAPIPGVVSWLSPTMGRKTARTGDPAEKADRDVREVLVSVPGELTLPLDHRVTVRFIAR